MLTGRRFSTHRRLFAGAFIVLVALASGLHAQEIAVEPGQDFARVLRDAPDGATIRLTTGVFGSPIIVRGKTLTIDGQDDGSSVITADQADSLIIITEGGRAAISDVTLRPNAQGQLAAYVHDAALELEGCHVRGGDGFYAEAGILKLSNCVASDLPGDGVVGLGGSVIEISSSELTAIAGSGVALQDGKTLGVRDSRIESAAEAVLVRGAAAASIIESNLAVTSKERPAIYIDAASLVPIVLRGNTISGGGMSAFMRPGSMPVVAENNTMIGAASAGLGVLASLENASTIASNRIALEGDNQSAAGIYLQGKLTANLSDNTILVGQGNGVVLHEGAAATMADNLIVAGTAALTFPEADPVLTSLDNDILLPIPPPGTALQLDDRTSALLGSLDGRLGNEIRAVGEETLASMQDASTPPAAVLAQGVDALRELAGEVRSIAAQSASIGLEVIDGARSSGPAGFTVTTGDGNVLATSLDGDPVSVPAGIQSLTLVPAIDSAMATEVEVSPGGRQVVRITAPDALWLDFAFELDQPPVRELIRLLPPDERRSAAARIRSPWICCVDVDAGPLKKIGLPRKGASEADREHALRLARAWLDGRDDQPKLRTDTRYFGDNIARQVIGLAGDEADIRRLAGHLLESGTGRTREFTPSLTNALLAEQRLGLLAEGLFVQAARSGKGAGAIVAALQLRAAGMRDFDELLLERVHAPGEPFAEWYGGGAISVMLGDSDPRVLATARMLFDRYLKRKAEIEALSEEARKGTYNEYQASRRSVVVYLLAHGEASDWRKVQDLALTLEETIALATLAADPLQIADLFLRTYDKDYEAVLGLAPAIGADSARWARLDSMIYDWGRRHAVAQGGRADKPQANASNRLFALHKELAPYRPNADAAHAFYIQPKGYRPDFRAPLHYGIEAEPWWPNSWRFAEIVDLLLEMARNWPEKGDRQDALHRLRYAQQIDFIPHDDLATLLAEKDAPQDNDFLDLVLAYHKVARSGTWIADFQGRGWRFPVNSVERRPFLLSYAPEADDEAKGGAVSGLLSLEPRLADDRLVLRVAIQQAIHLDTDACGFLASICDYALTPYAEDPSLLFGAVSLEQNGEEIPLQPEGRDGNGDYVYAAALDGRDLNGLVMYIDLKLVDQVQPLAFSLYHGEWRRQLRLAQSRAEDLAGAVQKEPENARAQLAYGEALQFAGRPGEAWEVYRSVLELRPDLTPLWTHGAAMFLRDGDFDKAERLLEDALAAASDPDRSDFLLPLGAVAYEAGDYARAAELFRRAADANSGSAEAKLLGAHALLLAGDTDGAGAAYETVEAISGEAPRLLLIKHLAREDAPSSYQLDQVVKSYEGPSSDRILSLGMTIDREPATASRLAKCYQALFDAERRRRQDQPDQARSDYARAEAACPAGSLEARLAAARKEDQS